MGRVEGKVALVTGAARGQGRSHAMRLAQEGADIIALDICKNMDTIPYALATEADLAETVDSVERLDRRIVSGVVDVRDAEHLNDFVSKAVAELGGLDIVSINAGVLGFGKTVELTAQEWKEQLDVNLTGAFNTARATIPHIIEQGRGGSVIFTASISGMEATPNIGHYTVSKYGVIGLAKTLALELGEHHIRVNAVCPGNVDTTMMHNAATYGMFFPGVEDASRATVEAPDSVARTMNVIPLPYVQPADISNAVLYLASDDARYVTGTTMVVDLGKMLK